MAAYPGALATFAGFTATHTLAADNHAAQHNLEQAEILAAQTKIGIGSSTPTTGTVLHGTGAGTSAWAQVSLTADVTGILPIANGGNGTTSTTGSGSAVFDTSPTISGAILTNSPTLTTPTVANFTNAQHNHSNAAGGGQIGTSAFAVGGLSSDRLTYPYKFYAYQSSGQAVTTGADRGPINLQTILFDTAPNFNTANGLFTAPIAGFYYFSWAITLPVVNNSVTYSLLYVNAAATNGIVGSSIANSTGGNQTLSTVGAGMLQLAASDTVGLYVNVGSNVTINAFRSQTYLQGYLLSPT